MQFINNK
ncbi:Protein of unknown function [Escherichia coli]|nr:Protein of unknown function [Escherichia coli]CDU41728.1 Protein of unknown function [Escherichia coli]